MVRKGWIVLLLPAVALAGRPGRSLGLWIDWSIGINVPRSRGCCPFVLLHAMVPWAYGCSTSAPDSDPCTTCCCHILSWRMAPGECMEERGKV
ncbi:hypothetical protein F5Y19DRAFT_22823 [Xylariaceae sp. FL1651]|nr:hypothetical protein F5Y19DRAFT_22823 [Xylariaceae sp. FL1651]